MKNLALTCTVLCLSITPALAFDRELNELNQTTFEMIDRNDDGLLSRPEIDHFRQDVMLSQDYDGDGSVTAEEHLSWDMGWQALAEERGVADRYWEARQRVFDAWDVNSDGVLNPVEQALSQSNDFYVAAARSNMPINFETFQSGLRIIAEMNAAVASDTEVTLINVFEVPEGGLNDALAMWEESRDFLQTQPGYVSTSLHQSIAPDAKFALINVAVWESIEAFQSASAAMRADSGIAPVEGLSFTPGLYKIAATD